MGFLRLGAAGPFLAVICLVGLGGGRAQAQDGGDHDRAVAAFEEARKLIDAGDCASALLRLGQSLRYEPSVGAHLSMADCYETTDPLVAWTHLREAERLAYLKHDDRRAIAHQRATALEAKLPVVRLQIPQSALDEPGLELRVDGVRIDPYFYDDATFALTPGPHDMSASLPGRSWSKRVVAQLGAVTTLIVELASSCSSATASPPAPSAQGGAEATSRASDPGAARRSIAYVLGGVGLAGLGAGALFGAVALTKEADIAKACGGNAAACTAAPHMLDGVQAEQRSFVSLSGVSFAVGGAALAGAILLYATAPHGHETRLDVVPTADAHAGGLAVWGRW